MTSAFGQLMRWPWECGFFKSAPNDDPRLDDEMMRHGRLSILGHHITFASREGPAVLASGDRLSMTAIE